MTVANAHCFAACPSVTMQPSNLHAVANGTILIVAVPYSEREKTHTRALKSERYNRADIGHISSSASVCHGRRRYWFDGRYWAIGGGWRLDFEAIMFWRSALCDRCVITEHNGMCLFSFWGMETPTTVSTPCKLSKVYLSSIGRNTDYTV